jgi:FixJ family two-component response regulator
VTATDHPLVAVVDDEAGVRTMLRRVLRQADFEVAVFASGEDFIASLALRVPACVILDVHMPGLSGFDVKSRLRAMGCDVPAIFITASDDRALDRSVLDAGGVLLLRKPFASDRLLETVNVALRGASPGMS